MEVVDQQHKPNSGRKRKRKQKGVDDAVGINKLPGDVIITILCRMSRKEAARTSVLARRWRYLWLFCSPGTLELDDRSMFSTLPFVHKDIANKYMFVRKKFIDWVNRLLKLHQDLSLDGLVIRFAHLLRPSLSGRRPGYIDKWIYFAMLKELKMLELNFAHNGCFHSSYEFPNVDMLLSRSSDANKFGFGSLRSLRLVGLDVKDDVVHYFLASCPFLEQLRIIHSRDTKNLKVVVPLSNLKVLEISKCCSIQSLEISDDLSLSELTLDGHISRSFFFEPNKHSTYSSHLVKLALDIPFADAHSLPDFLWRFDHSHPPVLHQLCSLEHLELNVWAPLGGSLHFFTSLIKASPLLKEFRIKLSYLRAKSWNTAFGFPVEFPSIFSYEYLHENLKVVKMSGYVGCRRHDEFVLRLLEISPTLEFFTINTDSEYYDLKPWVCTTSDRCTKGTSGICICTMQQTGARTRMEAKERAEHLKFRFPPTTVLTVM